MTDVKNNNEDKPKKLKRVPLYKQQNISVRGDKKFHYHIAIDDGERIKKMQLAGYVFASISEISLEGPTQNAKAAGKDVALVSLGQDMKGYLMKIPVKYYDEDKLAERNARLKRNKGLLTSIDNIPQALQRGKITIDEGFE